VLRQLVLPTESSLLAVLPLPRSLESLLCFEWFNHLLFIMTKRLHIAA
jgi:hypothetical protein